MKHLILIAIAFATLQVTAQQKRKGQSEKEKIMKDLTPEEIATISTKRMTLNLDLNESQQKQIKAILLENATFRKQKMEARQKTKEENKDKTKSKEVFVERTNEKLDREIATKAKIKAILTQEQFEKWEKTQSRKNKRPKRKHKRKSDN